MDRMDDCALAPWISTALNCHFNNQGNKTSSPIEEVTSLGHCHVWNVKNFDKPIAGMFGMCDIDDSQLSIKALFTEDAVKTFEETEALTSCLGFCDINNGIMVLKKYHIMIDVTPQIEQCKLAICVDEFFIRSFSMSTPSRDCLIEALKYPTIARHMRQIWRAKYNSEEQDSYSTKIFSEDISQEQDALSELLEVITNASQSMTPCSETGQRSNEQRPHRGYYEVDKAEYNQWRTLRSSEVLKKVIEDVEKRLSRSIENPESVKSQIPDIVERGQGCRVHSIPAKDLLNLRMDLIDPVDYDTPDDVMQKLDNMEDWKEDYVPPCTEQAAGSSSIDITSFNTQPSVEHHKKGGEEQAQESVTSQRCKRKVAFSPRSQSHCKMAKSSESHGNGISQEQDQVASICHNSKTLLERIQLKSVPQPEMETEFEEEKYSENTSESAEGLSQLCDCLTPCEEEEDDVDVADVQPKHPSADHSSNSLLANGKESRCKSQKPRLREEEQSNRIGIRDSEIPQEELRISCDARRQSLEEDSFSDESCTSESLLLSCEIRESSSNEKQYMNKEQLEELNDANTNSDYSTEFEDSTQLETVPSTSGQQPKSCPKEQSEVKSAQNSNGSQQHVDFQVCPTSKLVQTNAHKTSKKNSVMFADVHTQTSNTSCKTSGVLKVAQISNVEKINLKKTGLPSTASSSSASSDCNVKSSRPLNKPFRPIKTAESSSLIASMCSLKMCGSDWISKSLTSLTLTQSRLKETSAIAKSSKRSTDGTTDRDDVAGQLKNYKLDQQILEWCASIACINVKSTSGQGDPTLTGVRLTLSIVTTCWPETSQRQLPLVIASVVLEMFQKKQVSL